jgi:hypothetical protein
MFLKQLAIRRKDTWEDKARPLVGSVWFENEEGTEIKINVDEPTSARIVELCAQGIVDAGKEVAGALTADMVKYKALEHKE